jgi:hypothetical protein
MTLALKADGPTWQSPICVWVKSKYLDIDSYFSSGGDYPEMDGASWPLGIPLTWERQTDADPRVSVIDGAFDYHVKNAWKLPWQYSTLTIQTPPRRSMTNFTIRNIGYWNRDPAKFAQLMRLLHDRRFEFPGAGTVRKAFAITPFCVLSQHWLEEPAGTEPIVDTYLIFFYTFETFLQESLALEAHRNGVDAGKIASSYEHIYTHARRPPDVVLEDPSNLVMTSLAGSSPVWDEIRATKSSKDARRGQTDHARALLRKIRRTLFELRLQTHLMVGIAAACRGISRFEREGSSSKLTTTMEHPPTVSDLAPFWLRHLLGCYDHADECEAMLISLAKQYGTRLISGADNKLRPQSIQARTVAEESIATARGPLLDSADEPGIGSSCREIFATFLDDESLLRWRQGTVSRR